MIGIGTLLSASLLPFCLALAGLRMLAADAGRRLLLERRDTILGPYRIAQPVGRSPRSSPLRGSQNPRLWKIFSRIIAMDPIRPDAYSLPFWLVLPIGLGCGCAARWLLRGLFGSTAWLLVPAVALVLTRNFHQTSDAKRIGKIYRQFPDALTMIVRAVRVGIPVAEALAGVSRDAEQPTAGIFGRLHNQIGIGKPLHEALAEMATHTGVAEYRFFSAAVGLQTQTGGSMADCLENLADVIRKRVAIKARAYALTAEARTSAMVLVALPLFSGLALSIADPAYLLPLFIEGKGQTLFGLTVMWLVLGLLAMRGIIRRSLS